MESPLSSDTEMEILISRITVGGQVEFMERGDVYGK